MERIVDIVAYPTSFPLPQNATAQPIDATTGYHVWAERYDRDLGDIFALQDEVTEQIVSTLAIQLPTGEQARLERMAFGAQSHLAAMSSAQGK